MATLAKKICKNGRARYELRFMHDNRQRSLYGFTDRRVAEQFGRDIETYIALSKADNLTPRTIAWSDNVYRNDPARYSKLQGWGILPERAMCGTIDQLITLFTVDDTVKYSTIRGRVAVCKRLIAYFQPSRLVSSLQRSEIDAYRQALQDRYAEATWKRDIGHLKQMFNLAIGKGWITVNPFSHLKGGVPANKSRCYYVAVETVNKVLAACADSRERLIVILSRFGGLRMASELLFMCWDDIDLTSDRFTVRCPKKTHKRQQERGELTTRQVPLFPEVRDAFRQLKDELPEEHSEYVFPELHDNQKHASPRVYQQIQKVVKRAGLTPWPKLFQNMRSTRETELCALSPIQDVASWIGNTPAVAQKHYLQARDELFGVAAQAPQKTPQNPPQKIRATTSKKLQKLTEVLHGSHFMQLSATGGSICPTPNNLFV